MKTSLSGLLLMLFSLPVFGGNVHVTDAWLRLLPDGLPLAGYARVTNTSGHVLTLVAASSPDFAEVQMHRSIERNGNDIMQHLHEVRIAAGKTLNFAPGGYHLMLIGAKHALHAGQRVPVTLRFSDGSHYTVEYVVRGAAGK